MKDQYNNDVPDDLVALTCGIDRFNEEELKIIDNARWYDVYFDKGCDLAVSFEEIQGLINEPLGGIPFQIDYVVQCLHRYNEYDGFYHA